MSSHVRMEVLRMTLAKRTLQEYSGPILASAAYSPERLSHAD
jgi:hypothetical protein